MSLYITVNDINVFDPHKFQPDQLALRIVAEDLSLLSKDEESESLN